MSGPQATQRPGPRGPAGGEAVPGPPIIAPSLLSCDFARIAEEVARVEKAGADWLHVDVMDGHFVPNLTIGPPVVKCIRAVATKPLDVHLMITDAQRYAEDYAAAGAEVLTFHLECESGGDRVPETVRTFREAGVPRVGLALNPGTPVEDLADYLDLVDLVLVMSVQPGFGGQTFRADVLPKVRWLRERGFAGHVEMDGGLNAETLPLCAEAGADCLVAGSAIFGADDLEETIARFRRLALESQGRAS